MKKIIAVLLVFIFAFAVSACSLRDVTESVMPTPTPTAKPTPAPTPEPTPEPAPEPESPYKTVLDKYYTALSEGWGPATMIENGVNYMLSQYGDSDMLANTGYYVGDLDGDGRDELVIGAIGDNEFTANMIYDFYTMGDSGLELQFSGTERSRYYMCHDLIFINQNSSSAAHSEEVYYTFADSAFSFYEALIFDSEISENASWFLTKDYNMDPSSYEEVSSEDAIGLIDFRVERITRPSYIPFTDYPAQEW